MGKKAGKKDTDRETKTLLDVEALRISIKNENLFIKDIMDSIPPELYFASDTLEELREEKHLKADKKLNEIKLKRKVPLSKKTRAKRAKLDPEQHWTVSGIHQKMAMEKPNDGSPKKNGTAKKMKSTERVFTREELKLKLQAKIQALKGTTVQSLSEDVEKKRMKRRLSKQKMREQRKKIKTEKIKENKKPMLKKKEKQPKTLPDAQSIVFNKDKTLVFNKFQFTESGPEKKRKSDLSGKNYKSLIEKVERKAKKIKQLEETDVEKATVVKEKTKWQTVLSRAEGVKVKDDLSLLKKALIKKEQRKKRSKTKWTEREENVKKKQSDRQKKRTQNIQARKQEKIKKKIKRSIKKGRMIQGVTNI